MEELKFGTMIAVFKELFGPVLFWGLIIATLGVTVAYLYVLVRDRAVGWRKFLWAQAAMPFGAIGAVVFVQWITRSSFFDVGGPLDVIVLLLIATLGAIGSAILVYTIQSLVRRPRPKHVSS
ncbi:MAG: DUF5368 domain-containing protein [Pseudomonadota bacterium]